MLITVSRQAVAALLLLSVGLPAWAARPAPAASEAGTRSEVLPAPGDYKVEAGRVDRGTYAGWRVFHTTCYSCHGVDAKGTPLAPNLMVRIKTMTPRAFATKVFTSYRIAVPPGDAGAMEPAEVIDAQVEQAMRRERLAKGQLVMPAWEDSGPVNAHVLDLYAYLSARADGALGPGKPRLIDQGGRRRP